MANGIMARHRRGNRQMKVAAAAFAALLMVGACVPPAPSEVEPPPEAAPRSSEAAYLESGPFTPGVATIDLGDRQVEVWYPSDFEPTSDDETDVYFLRDYLAPPLAGLLPAEINPPFVTDAYRDVPAADGSFPLVLFSHGFMAYRTSSSFLTAHLASWGFVVAASDNLEVGLQSLGGTPPARPQTGEEILESALAEMKRLDTTEGSFLEGRVDTDNVIPMGHSMGGFGSTEFARRDEVKSWISLAAGAFLPALNPLPDNATHTKSAMWLAGRNDKTVNVASIIDAHQWTPGPSKLLIFEDSGHLTAFTDICTIGEDGGGPVGLAIAAGLPIPAFLIELGADGCLAPNAPPEELWPAVRHLVTAELRYRTGLDPEPVGLGTDVLENLAGVDIAYTHDP